MKVSLADAAEKLEELARRAEGGDEIVLTRNGRDVLRLVPVEQELSVRERRRIGLERALAAAQSMGLPDDGPDAARSQDFLYDDHGLPK
jgi:prevent-host-death family protein